MFLRLVKFIIKTKINVLSAKKITILITMFRVLMKFLLTKKNKNIDTTIILSIVLYRVLTNSIMRNILF